MREDLQDALNKYGTVAPFGGKKSVEMAASALHDDEIVIYATTTNICIAKNGESNFVFPGAVIVTDKQIIFYRNAKKQAPITCIPLSDAYLVKYKSTGVSASHIQIISQTSMVYDFIVSYKSSTTEEIASLIEYAVQRYVENCLAPEEVEMAKELLAMIDEYLDHKTSLDNVRNNAGKKYIEIKEINKCGLRDEYFMRTGKVIIALSKVNEGKSDNFEVLDCRNNLAALLGFPARNYEDISNEPDSQPSQDNQPIAHISPTDEIRKYKSLLDDGIITQEEFDAKKKQLLNI